MNKNEEIELADEIDALQRYVDQPGQWVDTTPVSVKKRQQEEWERFISDPAIKKLCEKENR